MAAAARPRTRSTGDAARATLPLRRSLKPSPERRPGGPARATPAPAPARPRPRRRAARRTRGTRIGERIRAVRPDILVDRLLRGRLWVGLIALLLAGIVFLNVALLEINGSIARMDTRASELRRDNSALRMRVARLGSSERIQRSATDRGFVSAPPGDVGYLVGRPGDAMAAARALERWPQQRRSVSAPGADQPPAGTAAATGQDSTATASSAATAPSRADGDSAAAGTGTGGEDGALTP